MQRIASQYSLNIFVCFGSSICRSKLTISRTVSSIIIEHRMTILLHSLTIKLLIWNLALCEIC